MIPEIPAQTTALAVPNLMILPDTSELEFESVALVENSNGLAIISHPEYLQAGEMTKSLHRAIKGFEAAFKESKQKAKAAHKSVCDLEASFIDPLMRAKANLDSKIGAYMNEQRRIERIAAEKTRAEAEAEARRLQEEARKKAEEARLQQAIDLSASGKEAQAERVLAAPVYVAPVKVAAPKPIEQKEKVVGLHLRTTYSAEIFDLMLLVQEVASGRQPLSLLMGNQKALDDSARAWKYELKIPGVNVIENNKPVNRG